MSWRRWGIWSRVTSTITRLEVTQPGAPGASDGWGTRLATPLLMVTALCAGFVLCSCATHVEDFFVSPRHQGRVGPWVVQVFLGSSDMPDDRTDSLSLYVVTHHSTNPSALDYPPVDSVRLSFDTGESSVHVPITTDGREESIGFDFAAVATPSAAKNVQVEIYTHGDGGPFRVPFNGDNSLTLHRYRHKWLFLQIR